MDNPIDQKERTIYISLILLCFVVYLLRWLIPLMEIDAAQQELAKKFEGKVTKNIDIVYRYYEKNKNIS